MRARSPTWASRNVGCIKACTTTWLSHAVVARLTARRRPVRRATSSATTHVCANSTIASTSATHAAVSAPRQVQAGWLHVTRRQAHTAAAPRVIDVAAHVARCPQQTRPAREDGKAPRSMCVVRQPAIRHDRLREIEERCDGQPAGVQRNRVHAHNHSRGSRVASSVNTMAARNRHASAATITSRHTPKCPIENSGIHAAVNANPPRSTARCDRAWRRRGVRRFLPDAVQAHRAGRSRPRSRTHSRRPRRSVGNCPDTAPLSGPTHRVARNATMARERQQQDQQAHGDLRGAKMLKR